MNKQLKLHLGCGDIRLEGYNNIDCRYLSAVDQIDDIKILASFEENTIDVIYASHVLEHFSRWEYKEALQRWYNILKTGGTLRVAIPDFEQVVKYYLKTKNLRDVSGLLYGRQNYKENYHTWCWDFNELKKDLNSIGFKDVRRYDWRETEHSHIDDYSQCYLPHMDKENGQLMSLNVECTK